MSQRNGYYERNWTTQIDTLKLKLPGTYDGKFLTILFERYLRNEKALLASILDMYIYEVSTDEVPHYSFR